MVDGGTCGRRRGQPRAVRRLREVAACVALTAAAFLQAPGLALVDTKVDLSVDPMGWLGRSLHMWNSSMFGQVQNQAYGYLWPMGPFYAVGSGRGDAAVGHPAPLVGAAHVRRLHRVGPPRRPPRHRYADDQAHRGRGVRAVPTGPHPTRLDLGRGLAHRPRALGAPAPRGTRRRRPAATGGDPVGARRRLCRRCQRDRRLRGRAAGPALAGNPPAGAPAAHRDRRLVCGGGLRHRLVGGSAAAARPVQPAVPRLHRVGRRHDPRDGCDHQPPGCLVLARLPHRAVRSDAARRTPARDRDPTDRGDDPGCRSRRRRTRPSRDAASPLPRDRPPRRSGSGRPGTRECRRWRAFRSAAGVSRRTRSAAAQPAQVRRRAAATAGSRRGPPSRCPVEARRHRSQWDPAGARTGAGGHRRPRWSRSRWEPVRPSPAAWPRQAA